MGNKAAADMIRTGCQSASVEGSFDLSKRTDLIEKLIEMGIEVDGQELIVRRIITEDKSKIYLNGSLASLNSLRELVAPLIEVAGQNAPLIEMTGQHENRNLLSTQYQLDILDRYAGNFDLRNAFAASWHQLSDLNKKLNQLLGEESTRNQKLDFLSFQFREIEKMELRPFEESLIEQEVSMLKNISKWSEFLDLSENLLYGEDGSIIGGLSKIIQKGRSLSLKESNVDEKLTELETAKTLIEDSLYSLRTQFNNSENDSQKLDALEERLSQFRKLQKKYGNTAAEILEAFDKIKSELSDLQNFDESIAGLRKKIQSQTEILNSMAAELRERRRNAIQLLEVGVNEELLDLNMKGVQFKVMFEPLDNQNLTGSDLVEFQCQATTTEPARSLAKVASGGELSRILLALKRVVGSSDYPRTYLFDEVDTGVSGQTAEKVGRKLRSIAKGQQVICITHLPQVAVFADQHFNIQKNPEKGKVSMMIKKLTSADRAEEIARLISGEKVSKTSLAHAKQLISEARG
jgi:DNA repair protein RecN (Recombination protein N)